MKKITAIALSAVLLLGVSGCFGGDDEAVGSSAGWQKQEFSTFSVDAPPGWMRVDKSKLSSSVPASTVAVYVAEMDQGFVKSMSVLKETLNTEATSKEYGKAVSLLTEKSLPEYAKVLSEDTDIHGEKTLLHVFRARNTVTDKLMQFVQSYFAKGDSGYVVSCVVPELAASSEVDICKQAVSSFRLK